MFSFSQVSRSHARDLQHSPQVSCNPARDLSCSGQLSCSCAEYLQHATQIIIYCKTGTVLIFCLFRPYGGNAAGAARENIRKRFFFVTFHHAVSVGVAFRIFAANRQLQARMTVAAVFDIPAAADREQAGKERLRQSYSMLHRSKYLRSSQYQGFSVSTHSPASQACVFIHRFRFIITISSCSSAGAWYALSGTPSELSISACFTIPSTPVNLTS